MDWSKTLLHEHELSHEQGSGTRVISHGAAVREALELALSRDNRVFVMGQGVDDPLGMFGITADLHKKYGSDRVFDTPLSEAALTGVSIGAALAGMRPVYMHNRPDFLYCAMDQIVNHASKWCYMFGGHAPVPMVMWAAIGRGWGGAAQHTQAPHGMFMHVPGLRLVMPSSPSDAKGLLIASISDGNPVLIIEHRWLFKQTGPVPEGLYAVPLGKGIIRRSGKDVTVVAISQMVPEALRAAEQLQTSGIEIEVIDPRTLRPLDEDLILESVGRTGRLVVADVGWKTAGAGAEIAAMVAEKGFELLKAPVGRIGSADVPTPAGYTLEAGFYPSKDDVVRHCQKLMGG